MYRRVVQKYADTYIMDIPFVTNMFLGVLLVIIVILLLQYMSSIYVFTMLFFMAILMYIITFNKSDALTWLVVFMVTFFVLQYIYFNQNIILTVSAANTAAAKPTSTSSTASTTSTTSTTSTSKSVPDNVPPKTVWYLSFQSD